MSSRDLGCLHCNCKGFYAFTYRIDFRIIDFLDELMISLYQMKRLSMYTQLKLKSNKIKLSDSLKQGHQGLNILCLWFALKGRKELS